MVKGQENLIPFSERTEAEQREIARKGGIASGKARRRKATFKKAFEAILEQDVPMPELANQLESMGLEPTVRNAATFTTIMKAISKGDINALKSVIEIIDEGKTRTDRREQNARIDRMKADTALAEAEIEAIKVKNKEDEPDDRGLKAYLKATGNVDKSAIKELFESEDTENDED